MTDIKEWYTELTKAYSNRYSVEWKFMPWNNLFVSERLLRINTEKKFFGLTTFDEDVVIANCTLIQDQLR